MGSQNIFLTIKCIVTVIRLNLKEEIVQIGYDYAKPIVEEWAEENGFSPVDTK